MEIQDTKNVFMVRMIEFSYVSGMKTENTAKILAAQHNLWKEKHNV